MGESRGRRAQSSQVHQLPLLKTMIKYSDCDGNYDDDDCDDADDDNDGDYDDDADQRQQPGH